MSKEYLFSSESVSEGHPDKVADQITITLFTAHNECFILFIFLDHIGYVFEASETFKIFNAKGLGDFTQQLCSHNGRNYKFVSFQFT